MNEEKQIFKIPTFAKEQVYHFESVDKNTEIYRELLKIDEEIEKCRLRNC